MDGSRGSDSFANESSLIKLITGVPVFELFLAVSMTILEFKLISASSSSPVALIQLTVPALCEESTTSSLSSLWSTS